MKVTKAQLNALRIHNPYNLAQVQPSPRVFVDYSPQELGRATRFAMWQVKRIGYKTDPKAINWHDNYNKTFICYSPRETKEPKRLEAITWATERYGIAEWECSPFGSYHPKGTLAHVVKQAARDQIRAHQQ